MKAKIFSAITVSIIFSVNAFAYTSPPKPPDYASCKLIDVPDGVTDPNGNPVTTSHKVIDTSCKNKLDGEYQAAVRATNMANNLVTNDNGGVVQPVKPTYRECQTQTVDGNISTPDYNCIAENSQKERGYNEKMNIYNMVVQQQAAAANQQQANADAKVKGSATGALSEAEQKAIAGGKKEDGLSSGFMSTSIALGVTYAGTCAFAECQQLILYASIAAAVMSMLAAKQANSNYQSASAACESYNNIASVKKDCGAIPPPVADVSQPPFPFKQVDPTTGTCLSTAPESCATNLRALTDRGVNIRKVLAAGPSGFAGPNTPFTMNPDGSVTMKATGKTLTAADFKDEAAMMAAGISAADAKALSNQIYGKDGMLAKAGLDAKGDLKAMNSGIGSFDMGGSGTTTTVKVGAEDPNKGALGTKDMGGGSAHGKRGVANDGLVRDFNGDTIGIANDDIFKMMNKRYILKSAQDSFIGQ